VPGRAQWRRRLVAGAGALVLAALAVIGVADRAGAHAQLVGSSPPDGTTLSSSPSQLRVDLTQSVFPDKTQVQVVNSAGRSIPVHNLVVRLTGAAPGDPGLVVSAGSSGAPTTITADLPPLDPDIYRVTWRTLSSDDLHATSGVFVFGVQRAVAHQLGQVADPLPPVSELLARWLLLLSAAAAAGAGCLFVLLPRGTPDHVSSTEPVDPVGLASVRQRLLRLAAIGSAGAAVFGVLLLFAQADVAVAGWAFAQTVLSSPAFALRWGAREASALVAAVLFAALLRRETPQRSGPNGAVYGAGLPALAVFASTTALLGHTGSGSGVVNVLAHAGHVGAALVWAGTLLASVLVLRDARTRPVVLSRFAVVGLVCLVLIGASGLVLTGAGTVSLDALLLSTYGRIVLFKVALVCLAALAAASLTLSLHPTLAPLRWRSRFAGPHRFALVVAEALVLVVALGAGAAAAGARPALGTEWTPSSTAAPQLSQDVGDLVETFKIGPNVPGRNFVTVNVYQTRRPPPAPLTSVTVAIRRPGGVSRSAALAPQADGLAWLAATDLLDEPGNWQVTVVAHRDGLPDLTADYEWFVADPSSRLARPLVSSTPYAALLDTLAEAFAALGVLALLGLVLRRRARKPGPPDDETGSADGPGSQPSESVGAQEPVAKVP